MFHRCFTKQSFYVLLRSKSAVFGRHMRNMYKSLLFLYHSVRVLIIFLQKCHLIQKSRELFQLQFNTIFKFLFCNTDVEHKKKVKWKQIISQDYVFHNGKEKNKQTNRKENHTIEEIFVSYILSNAISSHYILLSYLHNTMHALRCLKVLL